ncbi:MAG: hypothetical protein HYX86_00755 [Chloroflexi bacterium]|nr:hypothetical protein [Chloroflexota bacterium]
MAKDEAPANERVVAHCPYCKIPITDKLGRRAIVETQYSLHEEDDVEIIDDETEFYFCLKCRSDLSWDFMDKVYERMAKIRREEAGVREIEKKGGDP